MNLLKCGSGRFCETPVENEVILETFLVRLLPRNVFECLVVIGLVCWGRTNGTYILDDEGQHAVFQGRLVDKSFSLDGNWPWPVPSLTKFGQVDAWGKLIRRFHVHHAKWSSCEMEDGDTKSVTPIIGLAHCVLRKLSRFRIILNIFLFLGCSLTILQLLVESQNVAEKHTHHSPIPTHAQWKESVGYDRDQACQFPVLDPFDQSILAYVKHPYPIFCQRVQPEFTFTDQNLLKVDFSLVEKHRFKNVYYRSILRINETHIKYGNWTLWNITESPSVHLEESVEVYGQYVFDKKDIKATPKRYRNLHSSIHVPNRSRTEKEDKGKRPLNVLIFGIDSLSRSNFIRNLPKTFAILTKRMNSTVFRGYTKIDDNTFPNILAVLTGHKVSIHGSELSGHFQHDHVDHYPFIWKNFSSLGYVTGLAEEQPGVLSYKAKGFRDPPTDWYFRPFGIALDKSPLRKHSSPYCVGNKAESKILLDSISRFVVSQQQAGNPYFLFSFLWKLSHDKTYDVEMIDQMMAEFFRRLFDGGYFNDTVVFVMSDHGNRFDNIRQTLIGRYEERMPFLSVYLPPSVHEEYPQMVDNLKANVWRLTCQYDVYETLVDLVTGQLGDSQRPTLRNRGHSLFTPISKSRTCEDAHISAHFCVCQKEENLDVQKSKVVRLASEYALEKINSQFLGKQKIKGMCSRLRLKNVISAQKYKASDNVRYAIRWHYNKLLSEKNVTGVVSHLRVTFTTSPNDGTFEALVQYYEGGEAFNATNVDISRINAYGHDGDCVSKIDRTLEKFCYCKRKLWFL